MKTLFNCLALLVLAGCAGDPEAVDAPAFRAGYETGCSAASADKATRQSLTEGQPDLYRRGFNSGVQACGGVRDVGY